MITNRDKMKMKPIGVIHTPYKSTKEAPYQGCKSDAMCEIEIFDEYARGLKDVEGFSHLIILYWMHKSTNYSLLIKTPWDDKLHGLFTTRSQNRPNPIGLSVVRLIKRDGNILKIKGMDAIEGTPVIDIKPYIPEFDEEKNIKIGWLENKIRDKNE